MGYKIYEYVREARESEASVETLIEKAVEERTPKEPPVKWYKRIEENVLNF